MVGSLVSLPCSLGPLVPLGWSFGLLIPLLLVPDPCPSYFGVLGCTHITRKWNPTQVPRNKGQM